MIKTKSITTKKSRTDGIRICVMRRIHPEYKFDVWIPALAPSEKLLKQYIINKKISWLVFSRKFKKEVIIKQKPLLQMLKRFSQDNIVTLLCIEKDSTYCHRSILINEIQKLHKP